MRKARTVKSRSAALKAVQCGGPPRVLRAVVRAPLRSFLLVRDQEEAPHHPAVRPPRFHRERLQRGHSEWLNFVMGSGGLGSL